MPSAHRSLFFTMAVPVALVFLWSGLCDSAADNENEGEVRLRAFAKLERGMTPEQVRRQVGAPKRIARQILYHRYREQWLYDTPSPICLTFDCPRGQMPELLAIPPLGARGK
jgi:hypothetical protein